MILRPEDVRNAAFQICEASGAPDRGERGKLVDDAAALADLFAGLMYSPYLRLRFDVVTARLIGPGLGTGPNTHSRQTVPGRDGCS